MSNIIAKKVIIIGAGAAGIAAASRLCENGITDVLVLEAEDRIGGRIHTLDAPQGNILELGAQWVHGEKGNAVYDLVCCRDLLIPTKQFADDMLFIESNGQIVDANITRKMSEIFEYVRSKIDTNVLEYKTSGNYFLEKISSALQNECECSSLDKDLESEFIEWFHQFTNSIDASDTWFESSASTLTEYWECDGRSTIAWKENGYRQIFSILTENADCILGKSLIENYVRKHTEVVKIIPEDIRVRVKCDNGEEYVADHVIVTVSLGVLKANYEKLFPKNLLCDKTQKAIKNLSIGSVAKLFLIFPYKWWPDNISDFCLLWTQSDRFDYAKQGLKWLTDVFAFMVVDNCNETLCGWVCGQSARDMEALDEELVKNQLMQVLKKFLGCKYKIPEPVCFYRSTWKSNPHFNGTYSFRGISSDLMNVSAIDLSIPVFNRDNIPVILFAGEATHAHYYSTVHGAIETGWREADRLISLQKCAK